MNQLQQSIEFRAQFAAQRKQGRRAREAAQALGCSEGQALAHHSSAHLTPTEAAHAPLLAHPLDGDWVGMLQGLEACGPVMALTRNEHAVHEKTGVYRHISVDQGVALAVGVDIDLRLFLRHWHQAFHVVERRAEPDARDRHSLQFFDNSGQALHKVYARIGTDLEAFLALADRHIDTSRPPAFQTAEAIAATTPATAQPDAQIDADGLGQAWAEMRDTHEFHDLLRRFQVQRLQAMRLMAGRHTERCAPGALHELLTQAAGAALPIMVFVGNQGCIQIHTGPVSRVERLGAWLNVLDAGFNLHLREDCVDSIWCVAKPTRDGVVTSVEAYDADGELIAMFFGARKPGQPERPDWRELAHNLPRPATAEVVA